MFAGKIWPESAFSLRIWSGFVFGVFFWGCTCTELSVLPILLCHGAPGPSHKHYLTSTLDNTCVSTFWADINKLHSQRKPEHEGRRILACCWVTPLWSKNWVSEESKGRACLVLQLHVGCTGPRKSRSPKVCINSWLPWAMTVKVCEGPSSPAPLRTVSF